MKLPKVLIFTITYSGKDYVWDEWINAVNKISYPNKHIIIDNSDDNLEYYRLLKKRTQHSHIEVYHVERGNNSREALARSQNFARKYAIENGYDYVLSLESDIIVPSNVIQRLIRYARPCVAALYEIGDREKGIRCPCITVPKKTNIGLGGTRLLYINEWDLYRNKGLQKVVNAGLGCTLIRIDILKKYMFYYHPDLKGHSDTFFANCLWNDHIDFMVDTDFFVEHKNVSWLKVKDR